MQVLAHALSLDYQYGDESAVGDRVVACEYQSPEHSGNSLGSFVGCICFINCKARENGLR